MVAAITAEFRKVVTLKFWWALGITPLLVGLCASAITFPAFNSLESGADTDGAIGAVFAGLVVSLCFVFLFAGLFGAINTATEYRHKTITTTFLTATGRDGVIAAKLLVTAAFGLLYAVAIEGLTIGFVLLIDANGIELSGETFAVLGAGVLATVVWSLIGAGLGLLLADSVGATISLVVWYPVGELILFAILSGFGLEEVGAWLPVTSTFGTVAFAAGTFGEDVSPLLSWPLAPIVLALWACAFCTAGWLTTRERDIG